MARIGNLIRDPVELKSRSVQLERLATMLERITKKDIQDTAQALQDCASDIAYLLRGELIGCPCRRIDNEDNGTSYLVYVDKCPHHKHLKAHEDRLTATYEAAHKKLHEPYRAQLTAAALTSLGFHAPAGTDHATWAVQIADAALKALLE